MERIKISVSEYNEVNPNELKRLFRDANAELIKSEYMLGVPLGINNAFSDDSIRINNVILPLSKAPQEYYTIEIEV